MACFVSGCKSHRSRKENEPENISFHRMPADDAIKEQWFQALPRARTNWTQYSRICSKHFTTECFTDMHRWRRLQPGAVPTLNMMSFEDISTLSTSNTECTEHLERRIYQLERDLEKATTLSKKRRLKMNTLRQKTKRLKKKNISLNDRLEEILEEEHLENEKLLILNEIKNNAVIQRYLHKQHGDTERQYDLDLKKFAVTLHFLSPRAYNFVREQLDNILPHPKTISRWYQGIDCMPGFTTEALDSLKLRVSGNQGKPIYCALSMDEMTLRKLVEWDGNKYFGYVNIGCELDSDAVQLAKEALTFMVTAINDNWKIPVGYFLIDGITAREKANLMQQCLTLLQGCGVKVVSVTFDGAATNKSMCKHLGCDISLLNNSFLNDDCEICIWPDPCHNIKLVRNTFGDKKKFIDINNKTVDWNYIELLHKIQSEEGLHLANKLKNEHLNYIKQKMKVRLATQLMSNSVADALEYCKQKGVSGFVDCEGTIEFIRLFNNIFDVLNSRSMRAKGWKRPLTTFNIEETRIFFEAAIFYIQNLKFPDGALLINSNRSTGFAGFIICMQSLLKLYETLIQKDNNDLKYICTYKLSQDHIELFFGAIRSQCGFNNNPSARMFRAAYKTLLVQVQFKQDARGNCLPLEDIKVLNYNSNYSNIINESTSNMRMIENNDIENRWVSEMNDHDYLFDPCSISEYAWDVVNYMAGYVVRALKKKIICETCLRSLEGDHSEFILISIKNRGGLLKPSKSTTQVCKTSEKVLRAYKLELGSKLLGQPKHMTQMIMKTSCSLLCTDVFSDLKDHSLENNFEENHRTLLIKSISQCYLNIRIHHITKNLAIPSEKIRSILTKTVLFKGQ